MYGGMRDIAHVGYILWPLAGRYSACNGVNAQTTAFDGEGSCRILRVQYDMLGHMDSADYGVISFNTLTEPADRGDGSMSWPVRTTNQSLGSRPVSSWACITKSRPSMSKNGRALANG